jgi:hypothetical protein
MKTKNDDEVGQLTPQRTTRSFKLYPTFSQISFNFVIYNKI